MPLLGRSADSAQAELDTSALAEPEFGVLRAAVPGSVVDFPGPEALPAPQPVDATTFRRLSDLLLLPASMLHPQERNFAVDMIHAALDHANLDDRSQLARRLATAGPIAPSLVARLSRDTDLGVSRPLLRDCATIADHDLVAAVRAGGAERAYQVACRGSLSVGVADEIAATGDGPAVYAMLRNPAAVLTPASLARIAARARLDPTLSEPLLKRAEMYPALALDLFWHVDGGLRLYVLNRFLADSSTVRRILRGEAATGGPSDGTRHQSEIMVIADNIARGRVDEATAGLAQLAGVSVATAQRIAHDPGGEAVAIALKAAGARRSTFASAVDLWQAGDRDLFGAMAGFARLRDLFERLSHGQAAMAIAYWEWREAGTGPYTAGDSAPGVAGAP